MAKENLNSILKEIKENNNIEKLNELFIKSKSDQSLAQDLIQEISRSSKMMYYVLINVEKETDVLKKIKNNFHDTLLYKDLRKHLQHPDPNIKKFFLNELGKAKSAIFQDIFLDVLRHESHWEVRKEMAYILSKYDDERMLSLLVSMLDESDKRVSNEVIMILSEKKDSVLPFLDRYIKLPSTRVKLNIVDLLNRIKTVATLKYLVMLISDPSEEVKIKSQRSIVYLLEKFDSSVLKEKSQEIVGFLDKQIAKTSLKQIMYLIKILLKFKLDGAKIVVKDIENRWGNKTEYFFILKDVESSEKIYLIIEMLKSNIVDLRKKGVEFLRKLDINPENQNEVLRTLSEYIYENILFLSTIEKTTIQDFIIKNKLTRNLIEKLKSRYSDERRLAINIIGILDNEELYPILLKYITDPEKSVRISVARVLSLENKDEFIPYFEQILEDPDPEVQVEAARAILNNDSEYAKGLILKATNHSNPKVRELAMEQVGTKTLKKYMEKFDELNEEDKKNIVQLFEKHLEESKAIFEKAIDSVEIDERKRVVDILSYMTDLKEFKPILLHALEDPNKEIRSRIVGLVIALKDKDILVSVIKLLNDPDKRVRANVVEAFGNYKSKAVVRILKPFLNDKDNRIKGNAVLALYRIGYKEAANKIDEMINSDDEYMRASGAYTLGEVKVPLKFKLLEKLINDPSEMVRRNVVKAIDKYSEKKYLKKFFQDESVEIRNLARELSRKR